MKKLVTALASVALLSGSLTALPAPALAQSHGGSHASGGHSGGGYHGGSGGYRGGGYRGGGYYHGGGGYYRGGHYYGGYPYAFGGLGLGLVLGSAFASPAYYDYPGYSAYPGYYESVEPAPPPYAYDDAPPPQASSGQGRYACGAWKWDSSKDQYFWIPC